ncbi:MAG TPA: spore coat protein [Mollicutes bacterium]|nr:spore coat protein [Mollicutes bacterium]
MDTVPVMISSKDLDYIKDMLNWNFIAAKKANHYLQHIQDEEVATLIKEVSEMHKRHYDMLLNILQGGQNGQ